MMLRKRWVSPGAKLVKRRRPGRRTKFFGLNIKDLCTFLGSLILPLTLDVFTIIVTFDQRNETRIQRLIDRRQTELQREQDFNISRDQRELDKIIAENRRITDESNAEKTRNMSLEQRIHELAVEKERYEKMQEQRTEDVAALTLQRDQDKELARQQRDHDKVLAEEKQKAEIDLEQHRYDLERAEYLDALLLSHINELGQLLKENSGSLTANPTIHALVRAKTLNIIKQIGADRSTQLILFLHDTGQLRTDQKPLDLSGAQLNGIDLSFSAVRRPIVFLSLFDTYLDNASFANMDISSWNFSGAHLLGANFTSCHSGDVSFDKAILIESDFSHTSLFSIYFDSDMTRVNFHNATIWLTHFDETIMVHSNFSNVKLKSVLFTNTDLTNSTFYGASFDDLRIEKANMTGVDFSFADFTHIARRNWIDLNLRDTIFCGANLVQMTFSYCNLVGADMRKAIIINTRFYGCNLAYATLVNCLIRDTDFSYSNLSHVNMSGVIGLENQLHGALSISNAILPDGSRGLAKPPLFSLIPQCNASNHEESQPNTNEIVSSFVQERCVYIPLRNVTSVRLMQRKLALRKHSQLINDRRAILFGETRMSMYTTVTVRQLTDASRFLAERTHNVDTPMIEILLHPETEELEVLIRFFNVPGENSSSWLESIHLDIGVVLNFS